VSFASISGKPKEDGRDIPRSRIQSGNIDRTRIPLGCKESCCVVLKCLRKSKRKGPIDNVDERVARLYACSNQGKRARGQRQGRVASCIRPPQRCASCRRNGGAHQGQEGARIQYGDGVRRLPTYHCSIALHSGTHGRPLVSLIDPGRCKNHVIPPWQTTSLPGRAASIARHQGGA